MCCAEQQKTIPLKQAPAPRLMSELIATCTGCRSFTAENGRCERTGEHAVSRIGHGRMCPIGKHTIGEWRYWIRGLIAALKVRLKITPECRHKAARLRTCAGCDRLENGICKACGCGVDLKAADANQSCPLGKWEK